MAKQYHFMGWNRNPENISDGKNSDSISKMLHNEQIDIPDSLLPENIKKRLEGMDEAELTNARHRADKSFSCHTSLIRRIAIGGGTVAAAACVAAAVFLNGFDKPVRKQIIPDAVTKNSATHIAGSAIAGGSSSASLPDGTAKTANYNAAYESMKNYNRELKNMRSSSYAYAEGIYNSEDAVKSYTGSSASSKSAYSDTNIRTSGVDEGDIVKTDGTYIYVLNRNSHTITIYIANGEKAKKISTILISYKKGRISVSDMYVYKNRLILTASKRFVVKGEKKKIKALYNKENGSFKNFNAKSWYDPFCYYDDCVAEGSMKLSSSDNAANYTLAFVYDISKAEKPKLLHEFFQDGSYNGSRMVDGTLYIFSKRSFNTENIDKKDPTSYIPQVGGECVKDADVAVPDKSAGMDYAVISSIDTDICEYIGKQAVLNGASNSLYVSSKHIYFFGQQYFTTVTNSESTIVKLSYKDGKIEKRATGSFKGYILDDYCIDEKDGVLRFVTTYYNKNGKPLNGLFLMDENLKITGKITKLAKNEEIYSARFIGDTAYFVTYRNTDPLFAVDVSNKNKPEMLGYLKIPGFSKYLHPYSDNLLLGIGEETDADGNNKGIKLSMFDISNPSDIKEVAKEVIEDHAYCEAEYNPNALFIDTDKNIFGFGLEKYQSSQSNEYGSYSYINKATQEYMVFSYNDKKGFVRKLNHTIREKYDDYTMDEIKSRGIYIGEYFYIVTAEKKNIITSFDLKTFKKY